jgi:hypothetical protein
MSMENRLARLERHVAESRCDDGERCPDCPPLAMIVIVDDVEAYEAPRCPACGRGPKSVLFLPRKEDPLYLGSRS